MKKGISTVIATTLIILITVAAVAIVWTAVIPSIRNNASAEDPCMGVTANVGIVTVCKKTTDNTIQLRVKQYETTATINSIKAILYDVAGTAISPAPAAVSVTLGTNVEANANPIGAYATATKIAIAPIVKDGAAIKECVASEPVALVACA
jgi:hypothetical protein